jgi:hypothetical protein
VVAAVVGCDSGEGDAMPVNERRCKVLRVLGRGLGWLERAGEITEGRFTGGRPWRARWTAGAVEAARGKRRAP